jgi:hypothetical protein
MAGFLYKLVACTQLPVCGQLVNPKACHDTLS